MGGPVLALSLYRFPGQARPGDMVATPAGWRTQLHAGCADEGTVHDGEGGIDTPLRAWSKEALAAKLEALVRAKLAAWDAVP